MQIQVLLLDGVFDTGLASLLDCLTIANLLGGEQGVQFEVSRVGLRKRVTSANGFSIAVDAKVHDTPFPDVLVVPALGCLTPETLANAMEGSDIAKAGQYIAMCRDNGVRIATACTGTFVVAKSGVLDGLESTTTWWLEPMFREFYPAVIVDAKQMLIEQPGVVTAGAALGHVDLALWLVRQVSPQLAQTTAGYLLFDDRSLQASYAMADHLAHDDPMVTQFEAWTRTHLREFTMADAARAVGASQRTLQRHVQRVLGRTPIDYVRDIRVQHAIHRLRTSEDTLDEIADEVGYSDATTLRTVLRQKTGRGIRALRRGR